jgi:hypothetical protein
MAKRITVTKAGVKSEIVPDPRPAEAELEKDPGLRLLFDLQGEEVVPAVQEITIDGKPYYFQHLDMGGLIKTQLDASPTRDLVIDISSDEGFRLAGAAVLHHVLVRGPEDFKPFFASIQTAEKWVKSRNSKVMVLAKRLFLIALSVNPDIFPKAEGAREAASSPPSTSSEGNPAPASVPAATTTGEPA